jgi:hypothetical protein
MKGNRNLYIFNAKYYVGINTGQMGPIRCPDTSVNNYHTTPRNIPEKRRSHGQIQEVSICENVQDTTFQHQLSNPQAHHD